MTKVRAELRIRYDAGERGPNGSASSHSRVAFNHCVRTARGMFRKRNYRQCAAMCNRYKVASSQDIVGGFNGEGFGKDWGPSREGAVSLEDK
jgi:hypothetical protein